MSCSSCSRIFLMEDGAILASNWSAQIHVTSHWSWAENSIGRYRNYYFLIGGTKVPSDNVQNSLQFCVDIKSIKNQIERLVVIISYLINGKFPRVFKDQSCQKARRNHLVTKYKVTAQNRQIVTAWKCREPAARRRRMWWSRSKTCRAGTYRWRRRIDWSTAFCLTAAAGTSRVIQADLLGYR